MIGGTVCIIYKYPNVILQICCKVSKPTHGNTNFTKKSLKNNKLRLLPWSLLHKIKNPQTVSQIKNMIWDNMIDKIPGAKLASTYAPKAAAQIHARFLVAEQRRCENDRIRQAKKIKRRHAEDKQSETILLNKAIAEAESEKFLHNQAEITKIIEDTEGFPKNEDFRKYKESKIFETVKTFGTKKTSVHRRANNRIGKTFGSATTRLACTSKQTRTEYQILNLNFDFTNLIIKY